MADESQEASPNRALATIFSGDWLKVPGAVKAISRLVTSVGETGAAWVEVGGVKAEQMKEMIHSDTEARKAINVAVVQAASQLAAADPAIVDRAMRRWIGEEARKQENREAVASLAIEELEREPASTASTGPSDDWLNHFSEYAEKASSETVRVLWARILSGEVRQPGAVSLKTLQFSV